MVSVFTFCDLRNSTAKFLFTLIFTDFSPLKNIFLTSLLPTWYSICHFIAHLFHLYTSLCQHLAPSSELPYQEMWKQTQRFEHRMWWCYCVSLLPNLNSYGLTLIIVIRKYKVSMIFVQHKFLPSKGLRPWAHPQEDICNYIAGSHQSRNGRLLPNWVNQTSKLLGANYSTPNSNS